MTAPPLPNIRKKLLSRFFELTSEAVSIHAVDGTYLEQNKVHEALFGFSDAELAGQTAAMHLGERQERRIRAATLEHSSHRGELRSRTRDGRELTLDASCFVIRDETGEAVCLLSIARDVTQQRQLASLLGSVTDTGRTTLPELLEHLSHTLGVSFAFVAEGPPGATRIVAVHSPTQPNRPCLAAMAEGLPVFIDPHRGCGLHGSCEVTSCLTFPLQGEKQGVIGVLGVGQELDTEQIEHFLPLIALFSERAASEVLRLRSLSTVRRLTADLDAANKELQRLNEADSLTGVLNHRGLREALASTLHEALGAGHEVCAVLLDCDDFKPINDSLGPAVGDIILEEIAHRLSSVARSSDLVARVGGDEFLVVLPNTDLQTASIISERLRLEIAAYPIMCYGDFIQVTVSAGLVSVPSQTSTVEEILAAATGALTGSKTQGKNRTSSSEWPVVRVTDKPSATAWQGFRASEVTELLLGERSIRSVFQAIVRISDEQNVGHEVLSRGPIGLFENPNDFFRLSLAHNLLTVVDLKCLRASVEHATSENARVHVNVFPSTLLATPESRLLEFFGDTPQRFVVEISEQQFLGDPRKLRPATEALKAAGVRIAIDDVGFGRSSLETLIFLEPDVVKLDRSVVAGISKDRTKERLLRRMVKSIRALGAEFVAEGVEDRADLHILKEEGVEYGQGFLWGRPSSVIPRVS
ncbi:MAG: hypothetical protein AUK47_02105 [Deltaproteobacteria bacterium CG2_30_63_29]|nr:MAG: hypothetical protein AUK47_02105 [Deltaproteobacteria bacterium CG2_30_63_29]